MDHIDPYQYIKDSMDEVKQLIKGIGVKIDDNYKEFGITKLKVNTLEAKLEDYNEIKKAVRFNSKVSWGLGILFTVALTVMQIWGNK